MKISRLSNSISFRKEIKPVKVFHPSGHLPELKTVNIFLVGTGLIGGTLLQQIARQVEKLSDSSKLHIKIVGMANSRKMLFEEKGLALANAVSDLNQKGERMNLQVFFKKMTDMHLPGSVFVDCTSSEEVAGLYERVLDSNVAIVTPNKKANSGSLNVYQQLKKTSRQRGVRFLYETNVGAGLPVINTLNDLLLSGDKIVRIEAVLSGTLNFIFSSFTGNKPFSEIVQEAKEKGYTEPDPRDDLSGTDVARKMLILSRECGLKLELADIQIQNLVPEDCQGEMTTSEFFTRLQKHDVTFEKLRAQAELKNEKLRYQAILENGKVNVALRSVNDSHPFYSLSGSDNIILLTTERYHERPMVIRGPGAGAEVTAAGVFADIIRIGSRL